MCKGQRNVAAVGIGKESNQRAAATDERSVKFAGFALARRILNRNMRFVATQYRLELPLRKIVLQ